MRRPRPMRLLGALFIASLLLPQGALASTATDTTGEATAAPLARISLGCALVVADPLATSRVPAIACRWTAPAGVAVRAYRLYRTVDPSFGGARQLIATIAGDQPRRHADRDIAAGHAYVYRVVALGRDGSPVALSSLVTVRTERPPETLRFACALATGGAAPGVACRWSATTRPGAVGYVLYRSVDGGAREAIYRTGIDGRRAFLDSNVKPGQVIRYAVVARTASGRIVAIGGPDRVVIRRPAPAATAPTPDVAAPDETAAPAATEQVPAATTASALTAAIARATVMRIAATCRLVMIAP